MIDCIHDLNAICPAKSTAKSIELKGIEPRSIGFSSIRHGDARLIVKASIVSITILLTSPIQERLTAAQPSVATIVAPVSITSKLAGATVPMDLVIDFASIIRDAKMTGVVDPNSVEIRSLKSGKRRPHSLSPHFSYGDQGRLRWLIEDSEDTRYEIRFRTAEARTVIQPRLDAPRIGVGDLLRYSGTQPRPVGFAYPTRLLDLNDDGHPELIGSDVYTTLPLWPERIPDSWCPFSYYPGLDGGDPLLFGNAVRMRYRTKPNGSDRDFVGGYMHADVADVNGDKLPDLVFASDKKSSEPSDVPDVEKYIHIYLNSGKKNAGGMPVFVYADRVPHPEGKWGPVRVVDLDGDGAVDFVTGSLFNEIDPKAYFIRNTNPNGWPIQAAPGVEFEPGGVASFTDLDADGKLDSVCLVHDDRLGKWQYGYRVAWRKNLGGEPPRFGTPELITDIDDRLCGFASAVETGDRKGILVSTGYFGERVLFFEQQPTSDGSLSYRRIEARSATAPVRAGDQAAPFICDWDDDGDWDMLTGGGFGWVRILFNEGTNQDPILSEPQPVLSEGQPIVIQMSQLFPGLDDYFHDLGYVGPNYVDWDADGLPDVVLSNLSNRIYWYRNLGTRSQPKFGPRQQVICDGYEETPETILTSARRLGAGTKNWATKPADQSSSPFWWRARAGFGDLNGDGLMDLVTADANTKSDPKNNFVDAVSLFVQYRDQAGVLRLRKDRTIALADGTPTIDARYQANQTIVFDWDGDGLLDLVNNHGRPFDSGPAVFRNIGTKTDPQFDFPKVLSCYGEELSRIAKHGPYYGLGDMDGDGQADLIASTELGTYLFFRRTAMEMDSSPTVEFGDIQVFPGKSD